MNLSAIFSKTGKGVQEASGKTSQLSRGDRAVLSAIDGKTPLAEVQKGFEKLAGPKFEALIQQLDKDGFIGRDALASGQTLERQLCCLTLDEPRAVALGSEPVLVGDTLAGRVTSGGYGYTVGTSIAYAYLPVDHAMPGTEIAVEIFGEWVPGRVVAEPLYDPAGDRLRG